MSVVFYVEDHVGDLGCEHFGFPFWKIFGYSWGWSLRHPRLSRSPAIASMWSLSFVRFLAISIVVSAIAISSDWSRSCASRGIFGFPFPFLFLVWVWG